MIPKKVTECRLGPISSQTFRQRPRSVLSFPPLSRTSLAIITSTITNTSFSLLSQTLHRCHLPNLRIRSNSTISSAHHLDCHHNHHH